MLYDPSEGKEPTKSASTQRTLPKVKWVAQKRTLATHEKFGGCISYHFADDFLRRYVPTSGLSGPAMVSR